MTITCAVDFFLNDYIKKNVGEESDCVLIQF